MITIIPLPELIYNQYVNDGVDFNSLTDIEYLIDVSTINDIVEISEAVDKFPREFITDENLKLLVAPTAQITIKASETNSYTLKQLVNTISERLAAKDIKKFENNLKEYNCYTLKRIDEYLWVVVQKSLPSVSLDPIKESINANKPFINDMVSKLLDFSNFVTVAKSNLFRLYLDSNLNRN